MNVINFIFLIFFSLVLSCKSSSKYTRSSISNVVIDFSDTDDFVMHEKETYEFDTKDIAIQLRNSVAYDSLQYIKKGQKPIEKLNELYYENDNNAYSFKITKTKNQPKKAIKFDYKKIDFFSHKGLNIMDSLFIKTTKNIYLVENVGGFRKHNTVFYQVLDMGLYGDENKYSIYPGSDAQQIREYKNYSTFTKANPKYVYENEQAYWKRAIGYREYSCFYYLFKYRLGGVEFFFSPNVGVTETVSMAVSKGSFTKTTLLNGKPIEQYFEDLCENEKRSRDKNDPPEADKY